MKEKKFSTEVIVITGFMVALSVVLSKLVSINISFLRIGFGFLPIAVLAILYGPAVAAIGYALADLIGAWLLPTGQFFPGFTVSAILTGLIFGWVLFSCSKTKLCDFSKSLTRFLCRQTKLIFRDPFLRNFLDK